jgi:hypothetical protein
MIDKEAIMRRIDFLPDADLRKISKFLSSLEEKPDTRKHKADALSSVIGICEGPKDLAEKHDRPPLGRPRRPRGGSPHNQ